MARSRDAQRVAVLALLGGAVVYASSEARARVARLPEFRIRHGAVGASAPPPGLSPAVLEDVRRLPLPREANAYDRRLIPFAAALLRELEWVADVRRVELVHPASLRFSLTPRRPLGRVVEGGRQCVLTDDGALISARYAADPERLPEVTGLPSPARPLARQRALAAAIDVLEDVAGLRARVLAVDLGALEGDPRRSAIRLRLEGDVDVAWGRPDTDERPHLPGESKRAALEEFLEQGPPLSSVATVSLRWDETVYVLRTPDARRGIDEHQLRGIR
ncbi:MAG: hypothetical protein D6731_20670 [Planctomycetota bacterium]|nr:MAG: hypothetical protein D6731_20670 [Planctomycetota bacterium]